MPLISSMFVTTQIADERFVVCKACPNLNMLNICRVCGCFTPAKIRFRGMSCPEERWLAVPDDGQQHYINDEQWTRMEKDLL